MNYTIEQIKNAFENLPETTRKAMYSINLDAIEAEIVKKYNLHIDISSTLGAYITYTIVGLMSYENFGTEVKNNLGLVPEVSASVVSEVNERIFKAIREEMQYFEEEENILKELKEEAVSMPIPPPPYSKPAPVAPVPPKQIKETESGIYGNAGIEFIKEEKVIPVVNISQEKEKEMETREDTFLSKSGIDVIEEKPKATESIASDIDTEKETLYGIEHPAMIKNIIEGKLMGKTISESTMSDYSLPKITDQAQKAKLSDSYREPIE